MHAGLSSYLAGSVIEHVAHAAASTAKNSDRLIACTHDGLHTILVTAAFAATDRYLKPRG